MNYGLKISQLFLGLAGTRTNAILTLLVLDLLFALGSLDAPFAPCHRKRAASEAIFSDSAPPPWTTLTALNIF